MTKQLEASPNNPLLYNLLGQLWMQAKDPGQAETAFKKAIELDNSILASYLNLGQLYQQAGKLDQAAQEYEAVLQKNPSVISAHILLGMIHERRQEYEKAQAQYQQALKLNPKFAPAANNLAWLMAEQGANLDVALSYAQTAREQKPDDPNIADTLGWIYYKKNAYLLAVNLLKEAADKLPNDPVVQFHYGMAQYKNGNAAGAKQLSKPRSSSAKTSQDPKKPKKHWVAYEAERKPKERRCLPLHAAPDLLKGMQQACVGVSHTPNFKLQRLKLVRGSNLTE